MQFIFSLTKTIMINNLRKISTIKMKIVTTVLFMKKYALKWTYTTCLRSVKHIWNTVITNVRGNQINFKDKRMISRFYLLHFVINFYKANAIRVLPYCKFLIYWVGYIITVLIYWVVTRLNIIICHTVNLV